MVSALSVHGARCGAVSRHTVQALDVSRRVPGGAAQSSSQPALRLCNDKRCGIMQRISIACQLEVP